MHYFTLLLSQSPIPHPYLDPGTGSIVIQLVIAALLGGGILLRSFWGKIFPKKTKPEDTDTAMETEETSESDQS